MTCNLTTCRSWSCKETTTTFINTTTRELPHHLHLSLPVAFVLVLKNNRRLSCSFLFVFHWTQLWFRRADKAAFSSKVQLIRRGDDLNCFWRTSTCGLAAKVERGRTPTVDTEKKLCILWQRIIMFMASVYSDDIRLPRLSGQCDTAWFGAPVVAR